MTVGVAIALLVAGSALLVASSSTRPVAAAAWIAPVPLLLVARVGDPLPALVGVALALLVATAVALRGVVPLPAPVFTAFVAVQACLAVLPFALDRLVGAALPGVAATLAFPVAVTAFEYAGTRSSPYGSWGSSAYSQRDALPLVQLASVTGIWGITFLIAWCASTVAWAIASGPGADVVAGLALVAGTLAIVQAWGALRLRRGAGGRPVRVGVVLWPDDVLDRPGLVRAITGAASAAGADGPGDPLRALEPVHERLLDATARAAAAGCRIVVWPEASAWVRAGRAEALLARVRAIARRSGTWIAVGLATVAPGPGRRLENAAVLVGPDGVASRYLKARPVPGWEASVVLPGDGRLGVVTTDVGRAASAVCFDLDFPGLIRQAGRLDADLLLAPASDWPAIRHVHQAMAGFRAVENGLTLVRAARWGESGVVDALGRTAAAIDPGTAAIDPGTSAGSFLMADVAVGSRRTLYRSLGDIVGWACAALAVGLTTWGALRALLVT